MHQVDMGKNESPCGLEPDLSRSNQLRQHDRAPLARVFLVAPARVFLVAYATGGHVCPRVGANTYT